MAQARNTFIKSKMNQDLDARLMPNGEYREGRNINVSKSEGAEVGALENVLGNIEIVDFSRIILPAQTHLEIIGMFPDLSTSSIYVFLTNYTDSSSDLLSNNALLTDSSHWIFQVIINIDGGYNIKPLVTGNFLNFSKTQPILGCDVIEDLLFWTDDRNQPRKINVNLANPSNLSTPTYYNNEDNISVSKYYPYNSISFIENTNTPGSPVYISTLKDETSEYLPYSVVAVINDVAAVTSPGQLDNTKTAINFNIGGLPNPNWDDTAADITNFLTKAYGQDKKIRIVNFDRPDTDPVMATAIVGGGGGAIGTGTSASGVQANVPTTWVAGDFIGLQMGNPDWNPNFPGDRDFLKEKFARFSYRFEYEDNEFSLMAPFTQPAFLPLNYGSLGVGDEDQIRVDTIMDSFENTISTVGLVITLPEDWDELRNKLHVKNIQLLFKSSDNNNVEVIRDISINDISNYIPIKTGDLKKQFVYNYRSIQPWKTLPESEITRVNDITPIRAKAQASSGNRIIYGNFLSRHTTPDSLDYNLVLNEKFETANVPITSDQTTLIKEYYNHTVKQGRTYQLGVVLSDRYGRQSNVILSKNDALNIPNSLSASTVFSRYNNVGSNAVYAWFGNSLKVFWESEIPNTLMEKGYPGLYNPSTNPMGWYSYKYVVKQQDQEYYNIYLAGAMSGDLVYTDFQTQSHWLNTKTESKISLFGNNINKIPRDLSNTGPTDSSFGSETDFIARVIQNTVDLTNINNNKQAKDYGKWDNVITIEPFKNLGDWTKYKGIITYDTSAVDPAGGDYDPINEPNGAYCYPGSNKSTNVVGTTDPLYNADKNPYIATINTKGVGERIGFPAVYLSEGQHKRDDSIFSTKLTVLETKPFKSNLDIYWETSSSGIISELNTNIKTETDSLAIYGLSTFLFEQGEDFVAGTDVLGTTIVPITKLGIPVVDATALITLERAWLSGIGPQANLTDAYECYQVAAGTPPTYQIRTSNVGTEGIDPFEHLGVARDETISFKLKASIPLTGEEKTFNLLHAGRISNARPTWNGFTSPSPAFDTRGDYYTQGGVFTGTSSVVYDYYMWAGQTSSGQFVVNVNGVNDNIVVPASKGIIAMNSTVATSSDWTFNTFDNGSAKNSQQLVFPFVRSIEAHEYDNDTTVLTSLGYIDKDQHLLNANPLLSSDPSITTDLYPFYLTYINGGWRLQVNINYPPSFNIQPWTTYGFNNPTPFPYGPHNKWPRIQYWKINIGLKETFPNGLENGGWNGDPDLEVWFKII